MMPCPVIKDAGSQVVSYTHFHHSTLMAQQLFLLGHLLWQMSLELYFTAYLVVTESLFIPYPRGRDCTNCLRPSAPEVLCATGQPQNNKRKVVQQLNEFLMCWWQVSPRLQQAWMGKKSSKMGWTGTCFKELLLKNSTKNISQWNMANCSSKIPVTLVTKSKDVPANQIQIETKLKSCLGVWWRFIPNQLRMSPQIYWTSKESLHGYSTDCAQIPGIPVPRYFPLKINL